MIFSDLKTRTLKRLGEDPDDPVTFTAAEAGNALNEGQRIFAFITLCLESNVTFTPTRGVAFYRLLLSYSDWLVPVRVVQASGQRVSPATVTELALFDSAWTSNTGAASHYGCQGYDLFFVRGTGAPVGITYARLPATMTGDGDSPEIVDAFHATLIDYAVTRCRLKQGGQEFAKTLPQFKRYWDAMSKCAADTMARAIAAENDRLPFELGHFNPAALFALKLPRKGPAA